MAEDAVVRVVLVDSTSGANRSTTQSATQGTSTAGQATQQTINPDRLFRELSNVPNSINQGFKTSLTPVVNVLQDIYGVLDRDYDYSEKEYKESTAQTSLLKIIGAALSGEVGATTREIQKGLGIKSAESQMISALNNVSDNVRDLKLALAPELEQRKGLLKNLVILGASSGYLASQFPLLADTLDQIPKITDSLDQLPQLVSMSATEAGVAAAQASTEATHGLAVAAVAHPQEATQVLGMVDSVVQAIADNPGAILATLAGGAIAAITYAMLPEKEKEKSVNELLQELVDKTETTNSILEGNTVTESDEQLRYTQSMALYLGVIDSRVEQIVSILQGGIPEAGVAADETMPPGYENATLNPPLNSGQETQSATLNPPLNLGSEVVPDTAVPQAISLEEEEILKGLAHDLRHTPGDLVEPYEGQPLTKTFLEPEVPDTAQPNVADLWKGYRETYNPGTPLTNEQREELREVSYPEPVVGFSRQDFDRYKRFREDHEPPLGPPQHFAQGGRVGTDTIPAMLSPGEVVVPKNMVDGGAIDHLRGRLPGFASGGMVNNAARLPGQLLAGSANYMTGSIGSTDPGERISKIGDSLGAIGTIAGAAIPPLGAFIEGLGLGTKAIGALASTISQTVDQYAQYSPAIAQAQAMVEISQTMGDMRRAQQVAPDLAKFVISQGELQQKYEDIKVKALLAITPAITSVLDALNTIMGNGEGIELAIKVLAAPLTLLAEAVNAIRGIEEDKKIKEPDDPVKLLFSGHFDTDAPNGGQGVPIR